MKNNCNITTCRYNQSGKCANGENGKSVLRSARGFCVWRIERMSMSEVINGIEREMFERATKRNCGNCKWWADNEACVNRDSEQVADFTDKDFSCGRHEFKENKDDE